MDRGTGVTVNTVHNEHLPHPTHVPRCDRQVKHLRWSVAVRGWRIRHNSAVDTSNVKYTSCIHREGQRLSQFTRTLANATDRSQEHALRSEYSYLTEMGVEDEYTTRTINRDVLDLPQYLFHWAIWASNRRERTRRGKATKETAGCATQRFGTGDTPIWSVRTLQVRHVWMNNVRRDLRVAAWCALYRGECNQDHH